MKYSKANGGGRKEEENKIHVLFKWYSVMYIRMMKEIKLSSGKHICDASLRRNRTCTHSTVRHLSDVKEIKK
jgi:hypothetical protein